MKTLIFDLDGTLLNTIKDISNALNFAFKSLNFNTIRESEIKKILGRGIQSTITTCIHDNLDEETKKQILILFSDYYSKNYLKYTLPYKYVKETLTILKEKYNLVVLTNKKDEFAKNLINTLLPNIFSYVQGSSPDKPRKPDPYLANKLLKAIKCKKENAIYIGDTDIDYETGHNAGLKTILVSYGFRTKKQLLEKHNDSIIIKDIRELDKKINQI